MYPYPFFTIHLINDVRKAIAERTTAGTLRSLEMIDTSRPLTVLTKGIIAESIPKETPVKVLQKICHISKNTEIILK